MLITLADQLGLAEPVRKRAFAAVYDVAILPGGGKPEKYDFAKLMEKLASRLPR